MEVLVVSDEREILESISTLLSPYYRVSVSPNGEQALNALAHQPPDCVLIDMDVKGDTLAMLRALKDRPDRPGRLPIALLCSAAEISAGVLERFPGSLLGPIGRVASPDVPAPFAPVLENAYRPDPPRIVEGVRGVMAY